MNLIALTQPLSLITCLKIHLQATFVFFCATSVVQMYFLNIIWLVTYSYSTSYSVVLIKKKKKAYKCIFLTKDDILLIKIENAITKVKTKFPVNHFKESNITSL